MDPLSTLIDQHKHIREHLEAVKKPGLARPKLLEELRSQLDFHMYLEECCVYPLLEDYDELQSQVFGFWAEHEHLRAELQQLLEAQQDEDLFQANLVSLGAFFEEHAREEEGHVFPEARRILGETQLAKMDADLRDATQEKGLAA